MEITTDEKTDEQTFNCEEASVVKTGEEVVENSQNQDNIGKDREKNS